MLKKQETGVKSEMQTISEAFTPYIWENYIHEQASKSKERTAKEKEIVGINISFKVAAKCKAARKAKVEDLIAKKVRAELLVAE